MCTTSFPHLTVSPTSITAQASPAGLCPPKQLKPAAPWPKAVFFVQFFVCFIKILTVNTLISKIEEAGNTRQDGKV